MDNFSDDEQFGQVESIVKERKRKGVLEYLVKWKNAESGKDTSWEAAASISADFANAVKDFVKSKTKKRSQSKSRKASRSRSRSASRSRKVKTEKAATRRSTRSSSRGRASKIPVAADKPAEEVEPKKQELAAEEKSAELKTEDPPKEPEKPAEEVQKPVEEVEKPAEEVEKPAEVQKVSEKEVSISQSTVTASSSVSTTTEVRETMSTEASSGRVLRSHTKAAREQLEVQRVHNEQRPTHKDDGKPRSSVWQIADYAVIALFVLCIIAAAFMLAEKFLDLEEFKKQAFPNFGTLRTRLADGLTHATDTVSGAWLGLVELISGGK